MYADWGLPHLSLVVCYMVNLLIPLIYKTLFCKLQPPKYLLLFGNRLRYINNNVTEDRCSIPMDTTVRRGPLKFSLRATIDHHGPSIHSGHYTVSFNCCKKNSIATITQLRSLGWLTAKTPLLHMLYYMNWLTHDFLDSNRRVGVWSLPCWHILSIPLTTSLWVGWCVSSWWPLFPSRRSVLIYIYIYSFSIWVLLPLVYQLCLALWIPGCLWLLAFVLDNTLILGIWCSTIRHLPWCFVAGPSIRMSDSTWCYRTPLCHI